jgi:hypothetical protein
MLTVLWLLTVAATMAVASATVGRIAIEAGRNRVNIDRARWRALGCARTAQAAMDDALRNAAGDAAATRVWLALDRVPVDVDTSCTVTMNAAGSRVDLNSATSEMLVRLLDNAGIPDQQANTAAEAVVRLRENAPLVDVRELGRAVDHLALLALQSHAWAEPGRVSLAHAGEEVLIAVPGVTRETADAITNRAQAGEPIADLSDALALVGPSSRDELIARYPEASRVTTAIPDAWLLRMTATAGRPVASATIEWRLTRNGARVVVARARES